MKIYMQNQSFKGIVKFLLLIVCVTGSNNYLIINQMNTKILKNFGQQVKWLRIEAGLTQEELAEKLNIHRTYMSFIERGLRNPSLLMIFKISRILKIKLPELFSFDE